jgi:hypothetical protein
MSRDEAYREAERRIEQARREGATTLNLSSMNLTEVPESIASLTQWFCKINCVKGQNSLGEGLL